MLRDHFTPDSKLRLLPPSWLWWALWFLFPVKDQVCNSSVLTCIFESTVWLDMFEFFFFSKRKKNKSRHTREWKWSPHDPKKSNVTLRAYRWQWLKSSGPWLSAPSITCWVLLQVAQSSIAFVFQGADGIFAYTQAVLPHPRVSHQENGAENCFPALFFL